MPRKHNNLLWVGLLGVILAGALAMPGCQSLRAEGAPLVDSRPVSFAPLVRRVLPAVVNIAVRMHLSASQAVAELPPELRGTPFEKSFRNRLKTKKEAMVGAGSGFILDPSGIIVTNNHVVGEADRIIVSLDDGTELPATLLGQDDLTDIAVIEVHADRKLPSVGWGDSRAVEVGDWILAAGNPFGLGGSVTAGIVSARGRDIGAGPFDNFFQLDAPINPGNSGGPTFNLAGEVIALNTAIVSPTGGSVGIGFAIPAEIAAPVVADLLRKGRVDRGYLGVQVDSAEHRHAGAVIASVERGGPAAAAGLRPGDLVTAVNGDRVADSRDLVRDIAGVNPGGVAHLRVRRQTQALTVDVVVGRRPDTARDTAPDEPAPTP